MPAPDPAFDPFAPVRRGLARPGGDTSDYDLNRGIFLPEGRILRPAGVLVGLQPTEDGLRLILTKRASHLKHHPGQIAFPGGKVEPGDAGAVDAALREAQEEIGLTGGEIEVLGVTDPHETVTGFLVTPVIARIPPDFCPLPQESEVEEVFTVPFAHVADPANYRIEARRWRGQVRRYYTVPYGPYYIWGATARILRALADRMA